MGWFSDDSDTAQSYNQYQNTEPHKAKLSHELIGGAAAYEAAKAYEDHCARNGHPDSHAKVKEVMAGLAGAFIEREIETKGLDWVDRERAQRHAAEHVNVNVTENVYDNYYNN